MIHPSVMKKRAVIALGGNALLKEGQIGTIYEQFANTRQISKFIVKMIKNVRDNAIIYPGNLPGELSIQYSGKSIQLNPM